MSQTIVWIVTYGIMVATSMIVVFAQSIALVWSKFSFFLWVVGIALRALTIAGALFHLFTIRHFEESRVPQKDLVSWCIGKISSRAWEHSSFIIYYIQHSTVAASILFLIIYQISFLYYVVVVLAFFLHLLTVEDTISCTWIEYE